mmetsp:Transcript_7515/g.11309  ORF Transcript_7515/g.11309 Transcript_7515/m.11309 type:complete len:211 (-) Transcript_7515:29-661(-)
MTRTNSRIRSSTFPNLAFLTSGKSLSRYSNACRNLSIVPSSISEPESECILVSVLLVLLLFVLLVPAPAPVLLEVLEVNHREPFFLRISALITRRNSLAVYMNASSSWRRSGSNTRTWSLELKATRLEDELEYWTCPCPWTWTWGFLILLMLLMLVNLTAGTACGPTGPGPGPGLVLFPKEKFSNIGCFCLVLVVRVVAVVRFIIVPGLV